MKKIIALSLLCGLLFTGCNSEPSLQKYFVEKSENPDFIALDISPSILNIDNSKLTVEQSDALATFEKMNVLAFKVDETNSVVYEEEKAKVSEMLKDKKYQQLMRFGSGADGASVSFVGDEEKIDEFVLFATSKESGFAVVRILGNDMSPSSVVTLMSVIQSSNLDIDQLKPVQQMFQQNL
ncbi:MAG: DUF4252 domain-containing protein [Flavobacterium sp.]|nr:DUF4252 domain-containing protein [Flavobacterium sp.]